MAGIGHLGVGMIAKKTSPNIPLLILLFFPMLLDVLWIIFKTIGIDPLVWTHSFLMSMVWALTSAFIAWLFTRSISSSITIYFLVFSHWIVDFITHPMIAIFPYDTGIPLFLNGATLVGLGLYKSMIGVIVGETSLVVLGVVLYVSSIKRVKRNH